MKFLLRLHDSGRIEKDNLALVVVVDAGNFFSRSLRLMCYNRELVVEQFVQQG